MLFIVLQRQTTHRPATSLVPCMLGSYSCDLALNQEVLVAQLLAQEHPEV